MFYKNWKRQISKQFQILFEFVIFHSCTLCLCWSRGSFFFFLITIMEQSMLSCMMWLLYVMHRKSALYWNRINDLSSRFNQFGWFSINNHFFIFLFSFSILMTCFTSQDFIHEIHFFLSLLSFIKVLASTFDTVIIHPMDTRSK